MHSLFKNNFLNLHRMFGKSHLDAHFYTNLHANRIALYKFTMHWFALLLKFACKPTNKTTTITTPPYNTSFQHLSPSIHWQQLFNMHKLLLKQRNKRNRKLLALSGAFVVATASLYFDANFNKIIQHDSKLSKKM